MLSAVGGHTPKIRRDRTGATVVCKHCQTEFRVATYRKSTAKFCSIRCQNHGQYVRSAKTCEGCKQVYTVSKSREAKRFCSRQCRSLVRKDERARRRHSSKIGNAKYGNASLREMRAAILASGLGKCISCEYSEYSFCLDIHHIDHNPTNNDPSNLAVLCAMCHRKYHRGVLKTELVGVDPQKLIEYTYRQTKDSVWQL